MTVKLVRLGMILSWILCCFLVVVSISCSAGSPAAQPTAASQATKPSSTSQATTSDQLPTHVQKATDLVKSAMTLPTWSQYKPKEPAPAFTKGKRIAVVLSNAKSQGVTIQAAGFTEAAKAVGWEPTEFDGQGTDSGKIAALRNAVAQGVDGIDMAAIDHRLVQDPLREANTRGIPFVSTMAGNDPGPEPWQNFAGIDADDVQEGRKVASWVISDAAASGRKVNVLLFQLSVNATLVKRNQGIMEVFQACPDCNIVAAEQYTSTGQGLQELPQRAQSALQAHPETNYIVIDTGSFAQYVVTGVKQLGGEIEKNIRLISFDCVPDEIDRINRGDVECACEGAASQAAGWVAVDELNRALNKQPRAGNTIPVMLLTKDNNQGLIDEKGFNGGFDFRTEWKKFWGVN